MLKLGIRTEACRVAPIVLFSLLSLNLSFQEAATLSVYYSVWDKGVQKWKPIFSL